MPDAVVTALFKFLGRDGGPLCHAILIQLDEIYSLAHKGGNIEDEMQVCSPSSALVAGESH